MKRRWRTVLSLLAALVIVMTMGVYVFAASINSNDAALKKALKNAGLTESQVKRIEIEYDKEDGAYEVEFTRTRDGREYEYDIDAASGKIVKKTVDIKYKKNSSRNKVGKKAARLKVAEFSGISYKVISTGTCRYEYDNRKGTYKVKFTKGIRRYEYEVLAPTGKIIEYGWKLIN